MAGSAELSLGRQVVQGLNDGTMVALHPLEIRPDGEQFIVGRIDLGEFVALPEIGVQVIEQFRQGFAFGQVQQRMNQLCGGEVDVKGFVESLVDLGFVQAVDGQPLEAKETVRSNLEWLNSKNIGWLFSGPSLLTWSLVLASAAATLFLRPGLIPGYRDYFWAPLISLTILGNTGIFFLNVAVHELSHILAARSLDIPARLEFSTRLTNLVMQTNVTGLWAADRKARYRVYLAGLRWELLAVAVSILLLAYAPLPALAAAVLKSVILHIFLLGIMFQLQVYMRTDLYYMVSDLWRCYNLFGDSMDYLVHLARRMVRPLLPGGKREPLQDPLEALPEHERSKVRLFSCFVMVGAGLALFMFAFYGVPIIVGVFIRAFVSAWHGIIHRQAVPFLDGAAVILVEGFFQVTFLVVMWKQRREKFAWARKLFGT